MQNADEKLEFAINENVSRDYHGEKVVELAKIVDTINARDVLYVFYDKNAYAKNKYHIAAGLYDENGIPCIVIDDEHKDCLYDRSEVFFAIMLHELGHYRNKDTEPPEEITNKANMKERTAISLSGKV